MWLPLAWTMNTHKNLFLLIFENKTEVQIVIGWDIARRIWLPWKVKQQMQSNLYLGSHGVYTTFKKFLCRIFIKKSLKNKLTDVHRIWSICFYGLPIVTINVNKLYFIRLVSYVEFEVYGLPIVTINVNKLYFIRLVSYVEFEVYGLPIVSINVNKLYFIRLVSYIW